MFIYKKKPFIILFLYVLFPFRNIDTMSNTLSQEELEKEEIKRKQEVENTFILLENINIEPALEKKIITILKKQSFFFFKYQYESFESLKKKIANIENVTFDQQIKIMRDIYYNYYYYYKYYLKQEGYDYPKQEEIESIDILYNELNIKELNQNLQNNTISILKYLTEEKIKGIKEIEKITEDNKDKFLQSLEGKIELIRLFIIQVKELEKENKSSQYSKSINNLKQLFNQYFNLNPFINTGSNNSLDTIYNTFRTDEDEDAKEYILDDLIRFINYLYNKELYYNHIEICEDEALIYYNKINSLYKILYKTSSNNLVNQNGIAEKWIDKLSIDTNQQTDQGKLIDTDQQTDQGKSIDISTKDQGKLIDISTKDQGKLIDTDQQTDQQTDQRKSIDTNQQTDQQTNQENQNKTNPLWYMLIGIIIVVVSVLIYIFTKTKKPLPNEIIDDDLDNEFTKEL
jgi:hypothetical protein